MEGEISEVRRRIARSIRTARNAKGLSKVDLAKAVGVNVSSVSRWEDEADPDPPGFDKAVVLAGTLNVSLDQLAYGDEPFLDRVVDEVLKRLERREGQR